MAKYILVTGGAGYIGSHTVVELIQNGYNVVIADNLCNSSYDAVSRIEYIVQKKVPFVEVDIKDAKKLSTVFEKYDISGVIHFAALKAVGESTQIPLDYYNNNITGTLCLLGVMKQYNVKTIVFSSSATVYGDVTRFPNGEMIPIPEHCPMDPTNPYGRTKYMIECILRDLQASEPSWQVAILRYFNPMGAHPSGLLGEDPLGIPNNLLPYLSQVATGRREKLSVFGSDYDSHDGTPIRDYIHVIDLARGHIASLKYLLHLGQNGLYREWNLGTGKGSTVFDVYHAFCKAVGRDLPYEVTGRRAGDVLDLTANPKRANEELQWHAQLDIETACRDLWRFTQKNPYGFHLDGYTWEFFEKDVEENRLHEITNGDLTVKFANYGALITSLVYKGHEFVCGFKEGSKYKLDLNPLFGTTVGRVANRIANAKFSLNGQEYHVTANEKGNCLHGGRNGLDKQHFFGPVVEKNGDDFNVKFSVIDKAGNDGFPGDLKVVVGYTVKKAALDIELSAELLSGELTVVNLTNHLYFNLSNATNTDGTKISLSLDNQLEVDPQTLIPTGKIVKSPTVSKNVSIELSANTPFDNCFVMKEKSEIDTSALELQPLCEATHPDSASKLTILSTEPAFQFYTGDYTNTEGFGARSGFCIEPSRFIDAINHENWASQVTLKKDEVYGSKIRYEFS